MNWTTLATDTQLDNAVVNLKAHGFLVEVVNTAAEAKAKVLELIPQGAEVQVNTSETLRLTGIAEELDESGKYASVRAKTMAMDKQAQEKEMKMHKVVNEFAIGSAHAVTENGEILIASKTGSQLAPYVYGADKNILVIGTQKIVKDIASGIQRIYEHALPLEDARAKKAYGMPSMVSKILIYAQEIVDGRTTIILVKEELGF